MPLGVSSIGACIPEKVAAVAVEMDERLDRSLQANQDDENLQNRLWSMHKSNHPAAALKSRFGAEFLRQNQDLLE